MSRNLGQTDCDFCHGEVVLEEPARPITKEDAGAYFEEYAKQKLTVAKAHCKECEAPYLAWVDQPGYRRQCRISDPRWNQYQGCYDGTHFDLSHRQSFDDEPGLQDVPKWVVRQMPVRVMPWPNNEKLDYFKRYNLTDEQQQEAEEKANAIAMVIGCDTLEERPDLSVTMLRKKLHYVRSLLREAQTPEKPITRPLGWYTEWCRKVDAVLAEKEE